YTPSSRRSGGTGRRARLRGVWGNPWGFESPLRHHPCFSREKRAFPQKCRSVPPHLITQLLGFNPRPVAAALAESEAKTRRVRELRERIMSRRAQSKSPRLPSCGRVAR